MASREDKYKKTGSDTEKGRKAMGAGSSKKPKIRRPADRLKEILGSWTTKDERG